MKINKKNILESIHKWLCFIFEEISEKNLYKWDLSLRTSTSSPFEAWAHFACVQVHDWAIFLLSKNTAEVSTFR